MRLKKEERKSVKLLKKKFKIMIRDMNNNSEIEGKMDQYLKEKYNIDDKVDFFYAVNINKDVLPDIVSYYEKLKSGQVDDKI